MARKPKIPKVGRRGCHGLTKRNTRCDASALRKGTEIDGVKVAGGMCRAHAPELSGTSRFGSHAQAREAAVLGGRPANPKPSEVARALIEENVAVILRPHFRTLGFDIEITEGEPPKLVPDDTGGAKLYGTSKAGIVKLSDFDDLGAMIAAAERLFDRVYGRPKTTAEVSGPGGGPVRTLDLSVLSDDELDRLEAIEAKASAEAPA